MNSCLKKALCLIMTLTVVFALFVPVAASFDTAEAVVMDTPYEGKSITDNDPEDYYKFTTTEYGRIRIYFKQR